LNNLYAQYGVVDFEPTYNGDQLTGFHALFCVYGAEASLDSGDWWAAENDMAEIGVLLYAESRAT
jgi:hypothetical protein